MDLWKDDKEADAERRLWSGGPNVGQWLMRVGIAGIGGSAVLGLAGTLFIAHLLPVWGIWFGIGCLLFTGILAGVSANEARETRYTVTNRRIIRSGPYSTKPDIPIAALSGSRLADFGNGYGSIVIGPGQVLHCIENASQVYQRILSALSESASVYGWSTASTPCWPSDPFVARLAPGETYVWTGMPDMERFAKQYGEYLTSTVGMSSELLGITPRDVAASVCYAVTNYRALIHVQFTDSIHRYVSYDLSNASAAVNTGSDDIGTIRFVTSPIVDIVGEFDPATAGRYGGEYGVSGFGYDFIHLHACSQAFEAIKEAIRGRSPEASQYAAYGFTHNAPTQSVVRVSNPNTH